MYRKYKILSFVLIICMYTTLTAGDGLRTPKIDFKNKIQEILTSEKIIFDSSLYEKVYSLIDQKLTEADGTSLNKNREMVTLKMDALTAILVILSDRYSDINLNQFPTMNAPLPIMDARKGMINEQMEAYFNASKRVNLYSARYREARALSRTADQLGNDLICLIEKEYSQNEIQTVMIPLLQEKFNIKYNLPQGAFSPGSVTEKLMDFLKDKEHAENDLAQTK